MSNLAIAGIDDLSQHPVFRWFEPSCAPDEERPWITVGTDNPAIFATELAQEYGYLAAAAEARGHGRRDIEAWLQQLRDDGLRFSFLSSARQR